MFTCLIRIFLLLSATGLAAKIMGVAVGSLQALPVARRLAGCGVSGQCAPFTSPRPVCTALRALYALAHSPVADAPHVAPK